jgi:GTPase SAR1 family protein
MYPKKKQPTKRSSSGMYLKTIVLGDSGVGKTCLINRYVGGFYKDSFTSTLGVDFKVKPI